MNRWWHLLPLLGLLLLALSGCADQDSVNPVKSGRSPVVNQLTSNDGVFEGNPVYSPDGQWILFESMADGDMDIWMIPASGGSAIQVTADPGFDSAPFWSPDGRHFTFESDRSGFKNIYVLDLDDPGAEPVPVTSGEWNDGSPCWSRDGTWIVYESDRDQDGGSDLWMSPPDGGEAVRLTTTGDGVYHRTADFSPDSSRLVFESNRENGRSALFTMDIQGGNPIRITGHDSYEGHPAWSPDGEEIAYEGSGSGVMEVYVVGAFGGTPVQVSENGGFWPHWSPDGSLLVFGVFGDPEPNLWTMEVDW